MGTIQRIGVVQQLDLCRAEHVGDFGRALRIGATALGAVFLTFSVSHNRVIKKVKQMRIGHRETYQSYALSGLRDLHPFAYPLSSI